MTFEQFRDVMKNSPYRSPLWKTIWESLPGAPRIDDRGQRTTLEHVDWYRIGFALRIRAPNGQGFFGNAPEAKGARWCWPWRFYRLYFESRKAQYPRSFA